MEVFAEKVEKLKKLKLINNLCPAEQVMIKLYLNQHFAYGNLNEQADGHARIIPGRRATLSRCPLSPLGSTQL